MTENDKLLDELEAAEIAENSVQEITGVVVARKKPVEIETIQFTDKQKDMAYNFVRCNCYADRDGDGNPTLKIKTLEGDMTASLGDWIIKGVNGEFYPCKPDVFEKTYDIVGK